MALVVIVTPINFLLMNNRILTTILNILINVFLRTRIIFELVLDLLLFFCLRMPAYYKIINYTVKYKLSIGLTKIRSVYFLIS